MAEFNLYEIFQSQFGYVPGPQVEIDGKDSRVVTQRGADKWYKTDPNDLYGREVFMPVTIGGLFLPYCWISISGGIRIVETEFTERRGSVKEIINETDLRIDVKGFVFTRDGTFPETEVTALRELWSRAGQGAMEIDCPLTDLFLLIGETGGQDRVLITDWRLGDNKGVKHVRGYEMTLATDSEIILEIE